MVGMVGFHDNGTNDVIDAGTKAAAGDNGAFGLCGIEIELFARSGRLQRENLRLNLLTAVLVHKDLDLFVVLKAVIGQLRVDFARAKCIDVGIDFCTHPFFGACSHNCAASSIAIDPTSPGAVA